MTEEAPNKLVTLAKSRKFWILVASTATSWTMYLQGHIDGDSFTQALTLISGIYIGSVALEDGLRGLINVWMKPNE